jgi:hypothetical protein
VRTYRQSGGSLAAVLHPAFE